MKKWKGALGRPREPPVFKEPYGSLKSEIKEPYGSLKSAPALVPDLLSTSDKFGVP